MEAGARRGWGKISGSSPMGAAGRVAALSPNPLKVRPGPPAGGGGPRWWGSKMAGASCGQGRAAGGKANLGTAQGIRQATHGPATSRRQGIP